MIAGLFVNPAFLLIAAALISVPIIIHLINRMRFKRIRWAAMEFLLKAQKRTRRRLIIEQLLLLALRCFLIALVGLLVSRFVGCGENNLGGKPNLHLVRLDDTLSMQDHWKGADGAAKSCFDVAKTDFLIKKIAKGMSQSRTNDQLIIVRLSKLNDPEYKHPVYQNLNDTQKMKDLVQEVNEMQPSALHVNMLQGIKAAQTIIGDNSKSRVTLHILSDFREVDWAGKAGEGLTKELLELVKNHNKDKDIKILPIDTVYPPRAANQGGFPPSNDNIGIVDFRPDTRIVGAKMPVRFTVSVANFSGKQFEARLLVRNEGTGVDMADVDFNPPNPIKFSPGVTTDVTFDYGDIRHGQFFPKGLQEGDFAHLSVRLANAALQPLENDGILADNIRHTVVEVRDKVPILVIDGDTTRGRTTPDKAEGKDSFILERSLASVPGASYKVVFGDELPGCSGDATKALERADLNQYPTIFLMNVPLLKPRQIANLENFVKEGGGVAFYMGPAVNAIDYNKTLYRGGEGIFPAPLKSPYYPGPNEAELPTKKDNDTYELITREDKFPGKLVPIFGKIFEEPKQREPLANLPIHRYFKVDRGRWKQEPGRVFELATLPNDDIAEKFEPRVAEITRGAAVNAIYANPELAKYRTHLQLRLREIEEKASLGREFKAYHLANQIEILLNDTAGSNPAAPDMRKFWNQGDEKVQSLKHALTSLREDVTYGDPFVVTQNFGKGKVVAVMSTLGRDWNDWAGGSTGSVLFMPFIWELQNYLSSPGEEGNLTVGTPLPPLLFDAEQFKASRLKLVRHYRKTEPGKTYERAPHGDQLGEVNKDGKISFNLTKHLQPGLYISELFDENAANKDKPIAVYAHTFNVDTKHEGRLQRVGSEELDRELISKAKDVIRMVVPGMPDEMLISKTDDLSESPWLFLILLLVLVAEQALAVHLSFHLKNTETDMAPAGVKA
jgi:hypothetical protein